MSTTAEFRARAPEETPQGAPPRVRVGRVLGNWGPCGLALLIVAGFFLEPLLGRGQFYHSDAHGLIYPLKELVAGELERGRLPLWDPHSLCGYPVLASYVSTVFLPQNLLYLALPFGYAFGFLVVLKHLLAVLFQFLLCRRLGLQPIASGVGAVVFALSGPLLAISDFHAFSFECFPLMLWAWLRVVDGSRETGQWIDRRWAVAVLAVAYAFLTGDLQTVYAGGLLCLAAPFALETRPRRETVRILGQWGLLAVATAGLSAVQLLPSAALAGKSLRGALESEERLRHSLAPGQIVEFFVPQGVSAAASTEFIAFKYLGVVAIALALTGLAFALRGTSPNRRLGVLLIATGGGALLLALGKHAPVLEPLSSVLPGLSLFRYPQKWLGLLSFALATLAALGIAELLRTDWKSPAYVLGAAAVVDLVVLASPFLDERLVDPSVYDRATLVDLEERVDGFSPHDRVLRLPTNGSMPGLRPAGTVGAADTVSDPASRARIRNRAIAWNIQTLLGNNGTRAGVRRVSGLSSFRYRRTEELWRLAAERRQVGRLLDLFAARWVLTSPEYVRHAGQPGGGVLPAAPPIALWETALGRLCAFERPGALPRAFVADQVVAVEETEDAPAVLLDPTFDYRRTVVLHGVETTGPDSSTQLPAHVRFTKDAATVLQLEVTGVGAGGAYLVINDNHDAGWRARVDGEPAEVLRANYYARAVRVPAGECRVELYYDPSTLRVGGIVSALTLLALVVVVSRRRHGKPRSSGCAENAARNSGFEPTTNAKTV